MAHSKLSISNAEKDLECTICLCDFKEPKLLACFHTFCMTCLKRYCEEIDEEEKSCPLCRTEFTVPEGGVEMLKTDQVKARLVLEKKTKEEKQKLPKCDICENSNAEAYCVECMQCLCSACRRAHRKVNGTRLHNIVSIDEKPSEEELRKMKTPLCDTHDDKQIELYCCDCEKLLCYSCHATEHIKHACKVPSEIAKSKCEEFKLDQIRVTRCIGNEFEKVSNLRAGLKSHIEEISRVEKVVEDCFSNMIKQLEEQKSKLLTSLREMREEKSKTVQSEDYRSEFRCAELNSFLEYSRMMMERGTDYEILAIANDLHSRADDLVQSQGELNRTNPSSTSVELLNEFSSNIEQINYAVLNMDLQHHETDLKTELNRLHSSLRIDLKHTESSFKMYLHQADDMNRLLNNTNAQSFISEKSHIFGIAIHNNEVYMTSPGTSHILVYSLQNLSKISRRIRVPGLTDAKGLVYSELDSCLYVSNRYDPAHIYKINIADISITGWDTQTSLPWGLSISKQNNLLVSYRCCGQIDEFNGLGQLVRSIKLTNNITGIFHSVELETGEFIVCQWKPLSRICLVNRSGEVIKSYGKNGGSGVGRLYNPYHVELDRRGNILVSDCLNNKLRILTSDLKYVADINIADTEFKSPTATCWDQENDRLLVTTESKRFYVITPQPL